MKIKVKKGSRPEGQTSNSYRKQYVTKTPVIYEWQLKSMSGFFSDNDIDLHYRYASPFESYIYAFVGPRGSGKDESLSLISMIHMANGIKVFLNYPMKFYYKKDGADHADLLEANLLDMDKFLKFDDDYSQAFIGISEYQDWDGAYRQMTTQSQLIHAWVDQIRKLESSFGYTAKRLEDVGGKTVSETDFVIHCNDIGEFTSKEGPKQKGAWVRWDPIIDWSGYLTRRMGTFMTPREQPMFNLWGCYNTLERFNYFEAMRGVKLDLTKRYITDKEDDGNGHGLDFDVIKQRVYDVLQGGLQLKPSELWETIGLSRGQWKVVKERLPEWGIKMRTPGNQQLFYLPN